LRKTELNVIKQGEEMPSDFWNYLVNPIVGYHIKTIFSNQDNTSYTKEIFRTSGLREEKRKTPVFKNTTK
jgi:hypothetical protein